VLSPILEGALVGIRFNRFLHRNQRLQIIQP
jgi:hypothetical protein